MSVHITVSALSYNSGLRCCICGRAGKFKTGLDTPLYEGVYTSCERTSCMDECVELTKKRMEQLGYNSSKRSREPKCTTSAEDVPWMLENWGRTRLSKLSKSNLVDLCVERGIPKSGSKEELAGNLVTWKDAGGEWVSKRSKKKC